MQTKDFSRTGIRAFLFLLYHARHVPTFKERWQKLFDWLKRRNGNGKAIKLLEEIRDILKIREVFFQRFEDNHHAIMAANARIEQTCREHLLRAGD